MVIVTSLPNEHIMYYGIEKPRVGKRVTLFSRVIANKVEIMRVLHGRQDPLRHLK